MRRESQGWTDRAFRAAALALALLLLAMVLAILWELVAGGWPALRAGGWNFVASSEWDPVRDVYGAFPFIAGTFLTSAVALLLALPVALGIAILLAEYVPERLRNPLSFLVELLAAVPSIVYGLWGLFYLAPRMNEHVNPWIEATPLGSLPFFGRPLLGLSLLTASVVLAVMIIPIIAAISREVLLAVPVHQREAAAAVGLTKWETVRRVVVSYGRSGILSAAILGLGRALGETMAVTMLIGNDPKATLDLFQPGYSMSAVIANEFVEAVTRLHQSSLVAMGLLLFVLSFVVNALGRILVHRILRRAPEAVA